MDAEAFVVIAGLTALVFAIYAQVRTHRFVLFDDPAYVSANPNVLAGLTWSGVRWAFTTIHAAYWIPATWMSHMLDVQLFGPDAGAHLLVNALLHAVNAALLFGLLRTITRSTWRSAVVAALFAVHPLHVESVAWVSERKDTLSTLFFLLCLIAYANFVLRRSRASFAASVCLLAIGLLAKPMLVTTPLVLLLLDYWPFARTDPKRAVVEKIPFALVCVPAALMTIVTQREAMTNVAIVPVTARVANAAISLVQYLLKTVWPARLSVFYPFPTRISPLIALASAALIVAITGVSIHLRRSAPWLFVGWSWFVLMLLPVSGVLQSGAQAMADRFTYIPHIGLFIAIVWGCAEVAAHARVPSAVLAIASGIAILSLAIVAHAQAGYWSGTVPLFQHALESTSNANKVAHLNLAAGYLERGDYRAAEREYRGADGFQPADTVSVGLAVALMRQDKIDEAIAAARRALEQNAANHEAAAMIGTLELQRGHIAEAQRFLGAAAALQNDPLVLGRLALARGQLALARRNFADAVALNPNLADVHFQLGSVLEKLGEPGAFDEYAAAVRLDPNHYDAHMNYGALLSRNNRDAEAARQFDQALRLRPKSPEPHVYAALAAAKDHRFDDAARDIQAAISVDHDASNRILIAAIRIQPRPAAIDEYLAFLRQQSAGQ